MGTCVKTVKYVKFGFFYAACLGLIWTGTIGTDGAAYAQKGRQIGKTQIDAGISAKGEFNDNIYWTDKNETDDFIFTVTPDIDLVWENSPENFFRLGYTVDFASYMDDSDNNYARHNPYLGFGVKNPAGLYFRMDLSYINTEDPYGTENEYALGLSTKRWNNMVAAVAGFNFAQRYGVEARYVNFLERWDETFDK